MAKKLTLILILSLLAGCKLDGSGTQSAREGTLLPLEVGRSWTYVIQTSGGATCSPTDNQMTVVGQTTLGGQTAFQTTMPCGGGQSSYFAFNLNQVLGYINNSLWKPVIDLPLETDYTWNVGSLKYTWNTVAGSLTSPAGTFNDCYTRVEGNGGPSFTQFCHGVGIVVIHNDNGAGQIWDADLSARNFQ